MAAFLPTRPLSRQPRNRRVEANAVSVAGAAALACAWAYSLGGDRHAFYDE